MRFGVLGPFAVWTKDGAAVAIPGAKVRALLADLLIHAGEPVSTDRLVEDLWGDEVPANPTGALQAKVSQLRRALEQAEPGGRALVVSRQSGYLLQVDGNAVDARQFTALAARARVASEPRAAAGLLADALATWRGPAFADFADEAFARAAIARLEEQRLAALEDQAEARLALGEYGSLIGELDTLLTRHPLRERLRAAHMRALYGSGRQAEALESYQQLRTRLAGELGLDPSPELARLHQAILAQDPTLDRPTPLTQAARPRTNMPVPLSSFVGRANAVAEVRKLLEAGRLVTLTGPGGVGKTRLALETATQLIDDLPDGAWVVELAGWDDPCGADVVGCLAEFVAATLGVRDDAALAFFPAGQRVDQPDRLAAALRTKQLLLVLDNCEHAIGPAAQLAELLLRSAPGLRILATSREPLGLSGELLWPVPPLELPDPAERPHPEDLQRSSAVQLFVERAAAAKPGFTVDKDNAAAIATVCRRLDGLPLALELAAARVRALGVHELAARLDDRFRLLASGHRDGPARQQTLRAMIDWSWELLTAAERAVLRRLAVHADGFTLAAAEVVCAQAGVDSAEVVDLLARLVDRSLVIAEERSGGVRYRLLESIAAYCLERLDEAGEAEYARRRHARFYTELAEEADRHLRGHEQRQWLERLDVETADLRVALEWLVEAGEAELALRLVNGLAWYWFLRGRHREAYRSLTTALSANGQQPVAARATALTWLSAITSLERTGSDAVELGRAALELHDQVDEPAARAHARWLLGFVMCGRADTSSGARLVDQALTDFRRLGDRWGIAAALSVRGWEAMRRSELAEAGRDGEESRSLFGELGDRWGQVRTADLLGVLAEIRGDYEEAARRHGDGLLMAEELGLWPVATQQLVRLGRLAALAGDYPTANEFHERALRLAREQAFQLGVTFALVGLGLVARRQGRLEAAEAHLSAVLDMHRADGFQPGMAFVLAELGFVAELRGDVELARARHRESLEFARETGDPRAVALALEGLAGADALAGDHADAAVLLGAAAAIRDSVGSPLPVAERTDVDRITGAVRAVIGADEFSTAFQRGQGTSLDDCLAAVQERGHTPVPSPHWERPLDRV